MKNIQFLFKIAVLAVVFSQQVQAQSIGIKGGLSWATMGYNSLSSGNYVNAEPGDGHFIALPFNYRVTKHFSIGVEPTFSTRIVDINHQFVTTSDMGNALRTVHRSVNTKVVSMPVDLNLHIPWRMFEIVVSAGMQFGQNTETRVSNLDVDTGWSDEFTIPAELRNDQLQTAWTLSGGIRYKVGKVTVLADMRFARTLADYALEYDFDHVANNPSAINTLLPGLGLMYQLSK